MSSVNITREEAQQRSQVITAHSSKVLVDLSAVSYTHLTLPTIYSV